MNKSGIVVIMAMIVAASVPGQGAPAWAQPRNVPEPGDDGGDGDNGGDATPGDAGGPGQTGTGPGNDESGAGDGVSGIEADSDVLVTEAREGATMPWSEGVPMDVRRQAREIFFEANKLATGRFFATAAARYREAIALWPHPAFYYNLAVVQMSLDDPVSAHDSLGQALQYGAEPLGEDKHKEAQQYHKLLGSRLARLVIACNVPGAQVSLDGTPIFTGPGRYEAVMRPGGYYIEATKRGHIGDTRQVILGAGRESRYDMVLQREVKERRMAKWIPWTVLGAGAALAAAGGIFHWQAARDFDEYDNAFARLPSCNEGCLADKLSEEDAEQLKAIDAGWARARRERGMAVLGYGVGAAVLISGGVLVYLNREHAVLRQVGGATAESSNVSITPMIGPRGAGMRAGVRF